MRKHLLVGTAIFLLILVIDLMACVWYINFSEKHFANRELGKSECAVVLSGDYSQDGQIGEESLRRCSHALHLFTEKRVRKIICSGGYRPWRKETSAEQARRWLREHNVPLDALFAENSSCSTIHNLHNSLNMAKNLGCQKIIIISSSLHLFRAEILLNDMNTPEGVEIFLEPYSAQNTHPKVGFFTLIEQVHHEWISLALYKLLPRPWYNWLVSFVRGCS
jgi:uncharacterized SAM-binding protein YcdF (DUF218 family)